MNVFKIGKEIRKVGHRYGLPMWFVDCGLGVQYAPEDLVRKMASIGLQKGDWVVIRKGMQERGIGVLVEVLGYVGCGVEVEASSGDATPGWFTKASWIVQWSPNGRFNYGALRKGHDMLVCKEEELGDVLKRTNNTLIDVGLTLDGQVDFDKIWGSKVRVYEKEVA